jgi:hypothetical protein
MMDDAQRNGLRAIKERDGISESEQIRRAINDWLVARGITAGTTAAPRRAVTRRKA